MMDAAEDFARLRRLAGLTKAEAASLLGHDERTIEDFEAADGTARRPPIVAFQVLKGLLAANGLDHRPDFAKGDAPRLVHPATSPMPAKAGARRYAAQSAIKAHGKTYTPTNLARFVSSEILRYAGELRGKVRVLDPAIGDGELILNFLRAIPPCASLVLTVTGFDTDAAALELARDHIAAEFPLVELDLRREDFLTSVGEIVQAGSGALFPATGPRYDIVIANPPYVRTQALGAGSTSHLANYFGLTGRTDLYHLFLAAIGEVISKTATVGLIVSNRFMTTQAGAKVRAALSTMLDLHHVWDLGDTRLFDAAVLPAVIVGSARGADDMKPVMFTTIYETTAPAERAVRTPLEALTATGVSETPDGRRFEVRKGELDRTGNMEAVWRLSTEQGDQWLATVEAHTARRFRDIGKVRVGVKTCADKVFIHRGWKGKAEELPELTRPLITHHCARRFRGLTDYAGWSIIYPHETKDGRRRAITLEHYPKTKVYLESCREQLETRQYVIDSGRAWYEIWVPQDPAAWARPKLVFRDIAVRPTFWIDTGGAVVNGDCYWLVPDPGASEDMLWLALGIANSSFIEAYYDHCFNNKLYAGRRRFMTQYVERFPLPDASLSAAKNIVILARSLYEAAENDTTMLEQRLERAVHEAFGLTVEEVSR